MELGEVLQLGRHRLMCGDGTNPSDVAALLSDATVDMVWTDPPYGINHVRHDTSTRSKPFGSKGGNARGRTVVSAPKYAPVIGDNTAEAAVNAFQLCADMHIPAMIFWGANHYADRLPSSPGWIVWDKERSGDFADAELAWTNANKPVRTYRHMWNGMLRASERNQPRCHPTQKPIALAEWCYENYGNDGDVVLDLFAGSGPALLAAERSNRIALCMEIDPAYCGIIVDRYAEIAKQPRLLDAI